MKKGKVILNFTDFGNREWKDKLHGGKADDKTPENFDSDDIAIGTAVEMEHTNNPDIATEISMDHDQENNTYYDELIVSGIADEEEAIDIFNGVKSIDDKKRAIDKIQRHLNKEKKDIDTEENNEKSYMEEDDHDFENDDEYDEDELGTDKVDFEDDEQIFDEEEPKNKKIVMEKSSLKNYKSFLKETVNPEDAVEEPKEPVATDPGPERKYSKENKYKFQIQYDKKIVDKLNDYNFIYYVPEGTKNAGKPTKDTHNIIIDILNLNYSIVDSDYPDIRQIDASRLKHLLDNL
jgi:hypothetical protein